MRADNEVTVDRLELKRAVSWTRRGRQAKQDQTFFCFEDDGFTVETARARTKIKSTGRWRLRVAVYAAPLKHVMSRVPATKELTLRYFDGWLTVGSTKLSALVVEDEDL